MSVSTRLWLALAAWVITPACESAPGPTSLVPPDVELGFIEVRDCRYSIEHDGVYIQVYASPDAADAYVDGVYPLPEGATVVKRQSTDAACADLDGYTAMRRLATGAAPEVGDWQWQELDAERRVLDDGGLTGCATCHETCTAGRDFTCTDP